MLWFKKKKKIEQPQEPKKEVVVKNKPTIKPMSKKQKISIARDLGISVSNDGRFNTGQISKFAQMVYLGSGDLDDINNYSFGGGGVGDNTYPTAIKHTIVNGNQLRTEIKQNDDSKSITSNDLPLPSSGEGTTDYNALTNKPKVSDYYGNNYELKNTLFIFGDSDGLQPFNGYGIATKINNNLLTITTTPTIPKAQNYQFAGIGKALYSIDKNGNCEYQYIPNASFGKILRDTNEMKVGETFSGALTELQISGLVGEWRTNNSVCFGTTINEDGSFIDLVIVLDINQNEHSYIAQVIAKGISGNGGTYSTNEHGLLEIDNVNGTINANKEFFEFFWNTQTNRGQIDIKQSLEVQEDLIVRGQTNLTSGTITTTPNGNNDITNKAYVDSKIVPPPEYPTIYEHHVQINVAVKDIMGTEGRIMLVINNTNKERFADLSTVNKFINKGFNNVENMYSATGYVKDTKNNSIDVIGLYSLGATTLYAFENEDIDSLNLFDNKFEIKINDTILIPSTATQQKAKGFFSKLLRKKK